MDSDFERAKPSKTTNSSRADSFCSERGDEYLAADRGDSMTWCGSFWLVARRATPMIVTMIFFQMVQLLNIFFVGSQGSDLLAGVGLGNMLLNVLVFAVTMGLNGTIESFVSWAYGAGDKALCGTWLNRARIVVTSTLIPVMILFLFIDRVLIGLKQDAEISTIARNYCVWTTPGWFSLVQFDSTKRLLQTIGKERVSTTIQIVTTLLHIGWGYLFIIHMEMGVLGAAIALNITYLANCWAQEFYIRYIDWPFFKDFLQPLFSKESFSWSGAKEFLKLGVPGTMMQCAEWWAFELLAIFAGILGTH